MASLRLPASFILNRKHHCRKLSAVNSSILWSHRMLVGLQEQELLPGAPLAIVDKRRNGDIVAEVLNLIGDVKGKVAVMVDDMIDTAVFLQKRGCQMDSFKEVFITNTIPVSEENFFPQLTILSVTNLLGETPTIILVALSLSNLGY